MESALARLAREALPWLPAASVASLLLLVVGGLFGVWFVRRLPEDLLHRRAVSPRGPWGWLAWCARNAAATGLLVAGLLMLVLPGQGLLTLLAALIVADFPGKRRLERRVLGVEWVLRALNRVREGGGRRPLEPPRSGGAPQSQDRG